MAPERMVPSLCVLRSAPMQKCHGELFGSISITIASSNLKEKEGFHLADTQISLSFSSVKNPHKVCAERGRGNASDPLMTNAKKLLQSVR